MSSALPYQVALVADHPDIGDGMLASVAAALQHQVHRDFAPIWKVDAVVAAFPNLGSVPVGYWSIVVKDKLDDPGALGYHTDEHHQPISYVEYTHDWTVTCSHELLEMLGDPWGRRLWSAAEPYGTGKQRARILIEVCDPCENETYEIDGIKVSDFVTPSYYHTSKHTPNTHFLNGTHLPARELLPNGYISYEINNQWFQYTWFGGAQPVERQLGRLEDFARPGEALRAAIDRVTNDLKRTA